MGEQLSLHRCFICGSLRVVGWGMGGRCDEWNVRMNVPLSSHAITDDVVGVVGRVVET